MFRWLRRFSVLAMLVICAIPASVSASGGPAPTADYRFLNSLQSSVEGAPALTDLGAGGLNKFKKETVTKGKQWVYTFPKDNGVQLAPTTGLVANDVYTIVVQFEFANLDGFRRIADFKNGTQDTGLYDNYGNLQLYPYPLAGGGLQPNVFAQVVLTRDANGLFTGYVNGVQQLQVDDSTYQYGVIDTNNVLRFFRDNDSGGVTGEDSAGAVARIELFNSALSAAEVAALPTAPPKPTLKLNPKSGPGNSGVNVTGQNFGPHEGIFLAAVNSADPNCSVGAFSGTDATGSFFYPGFPVPGCAAAGTTMKFTATGQTSGLKKSATYKVTS